MTLNFPPNPSHSHEIELLLQVLASVVSNRNAIYVSAPITSGKRFATRVSRNGASLSREKHVSEVIEPNLSHARKVVQSLRQRCSRTLIDPTAVADFPEWTQDDYRYLWGRVIEQYASEVVFIDDWEYSNGCAYEFLVAQRLQITSCDETESIISVQRGLELIRRAIEDLRTLGTPTTFLEHISSELRELVTSDRQGALSNV